MGAKREAGAGACILLSGTLLALVLAVSCAVGLSVLYREESRLGQQHLARLALALGEQTALAFQEIDGVLVETREKLGPEFATGDGPALHRLLGQRFRGLLQGQALMVFGPDGRMVGHSREYPAPDVRVADRAYFRAQQLTDDDRLYISAPLRNRVNNRWMISLSRRLPGPGSEFGGVIMAAVEMDYFVRLYRALNLPEHSRVSLRRNDGALLVVYPFDETALGSAPPTGEHDPKRITAGSPVAGLPLALELSVPRAELLAHWHGLLWTLGPGTLLAVLGIVLLSWSLRARVEGERCLSQQQQRELEEQVAQRTHDLREALDFTAMILTASPVGIAVFDADGRRVTDNEVFRGMAGGATDLPAADEAALAPLWRQGDLAGQARRTLATGETTRGEGRLDPQQGIGVFIAWQCVRFFRKDAAQLLLLATDISGRRQVEEELRRMGALLRSMLRYLPLDFWARDHNSRLLIQSDISRENWGDLRGTAEDTTLVQPETMEVWKANNARALAGEVVTEERAYRLPSDRTIYVEEHVAPFWGDTGEIIGIMGVLVDLTPRRRLEEALRTAKEAAEAANRSKSAFLASMSHDIRTPLNGILGMLQLMDQAALDAEQREYLQTAILSTKHLTQLLSDILDLSRVEAGKLNLVPAEFSPESLRNSVLDIFSLQALGKGLELTFHLDPALPPRLVGDEVRLRQIIGNLVGNAIKFTSAGQVRVDLTRLPQQAPDRVHVLLTVEDSGSGITDDRLAAIFEPFVQGGPEASSALPGAGLGLAIVRRLVGLMGGELAVDNGQNGTTMLVAIPLGLAQPADPPRHAATKADAPAARNRYAILLVEDEAVNRLAVRRMLEKAGHAVTEAANGQEALSRLAAGGFDVVLMDIQMPVMDGLTACRTIREVESGQGHRIPIIAMTAYAMAGDRERFLAAGMDDYLAKPVERETLLRHIGLLLGKSAA